MTAMLPTFMTKKSLPRKPDPPPSGNVERVRLVLPIVNRPRHLDPLIHAVATVEGYVGDEVLVRFGEVVVQVPAEWLVVVE